MTENLIIFNARVVTPIGFSARAAKRWGNYASLIMLQ
jgi:hypothetical protein